MKLWEKAEKILNGGEVLLVASEDIFPLQKLASIPQLVLELETYGDLSEHSGFSPNCVEDAHYGCALIIQEIQKRLDALMNKGHENFKELEKAVEAHGDIANASDVPS